MPSTDIEDPVFLIEQVLRQSRICCLRQIRVEIDERNRDAVVLRGEADSYYHKQLAHQFARNATENKIEIINDISVACSSISSNDSFGNKRGDNDLLSSLNEKTVGKSGRRRGSKKKADRPKGTGDRAEPKQQLARSYDAFLRDLPRLLAEHLNEWVAYSGDKQIAIGPSKRHLYRHCLTAGYALGDFLVCSIEPPQEIVLDELPEV